MATAETPSTRPRHQVVLPVHLLLRYRSGMTKDGRPSRVHDVRLFHGGRNQYLKDCPGAWAFGRRLAWWLNGLDVSVGSHPAVYIHFTSEIAAGQVEIAPPNGFRENWWWRDVHVGVPADFLPHDGDPRLSAGIVAALSALAPHERPNIDEAARIVAEAGDECQFLIRSKDTAKHVIDVSTTIGFPKPSRMIVSLTDKATGAYLEAPPVAMKGYDDAVSLAGKVKVINKAVAVASRASTPAQIITKQYGDDFRWSVDDFSPAATPTRSGLLKFR